MKLRFLQIISWINVGFGALILFGGLIGAYMYLVSHEAELPSYWSWFFILIPFCMGCAFLLTGRAFLKQKTQKAAESSASGFAVLIWIMTASSFQEGTPDDFEPMPLATIIGILFAYACFIAIKRLVIKPCFRASPAS